MTGAVRWFLIILAFAVVLRVAVLLDAQWIIHQQQNACRAQAARQYGVVTGWVLPAAYPSHYDASLGTCTFFYQSFPPKTPVPQDYWMEAYSGTVLAQENSPGNAFKETCFFQGKQIDCVDFETTVDQIMSQ